MIKPKTSPEDSSSSDGESQTPIEEDGNITPGEGSEEDYYAGTDTLFCEVNLITRYSSENHYRFAVHGLTEDEKKDHEVTFIYAPETAPRNVFDNNGGTGLRFNEMYVFTPINKQTKIMFYMRHWDNEVELEEVTVSTKNFKSLKCVFN